MRVLVTFAGGRGHLLPMLPLAHALREAGHVLALSGHPDSVEDHGVFDEVLPLERRWPERSTRLDPRGRWRLWWDVGHGSRPVRRRRRHRPA